MYAVLFPSFWPFRVNGRKRAKTIRISMEAYVFENVLEKTLHIQKYPDKCGEERIKKYEREKKAQSCP